MADAPETDPKPKKLSKRHLRKLARKKQSETPITGRIRRRSTTPKRQPENAHDIPEARRENPAEHHKRKRLAPKPGRDYRPLEYAKNGMRLDNLPYDVGYAKLPDSPKFKPGQSGNPKGRPKGSKGLKTILKDALNKKIISRANGKEKKITTREGIIMRLIMKALDGDHNAIKLIMVKDEDFELETLIDGMPQDANDPIDEMDDAILKLLERQIEERVTGDFEKGREMIEDPEDDDT